MAVNFGYKVIDGEEVFESDDIKMQMEVDDRFSQHFIDQLLDIYEQIQEWKEQDPNRFRLISKMSFSDFYYFALQNSLIPIENNSENEDDENENEQTNTIIIQDDDE